VWWAETKRTLVEMQTVMIDDRAATTQCLRELRESMQAMTTIMGQLVNLIQPHNTLPMTIDTHGDPSITTTPTPPSQDESATTTITNTLSTIAVGQDHLAGIITQLSSAVTAMAETNQTQLRSTIEYLTTTTKESSAATVEALQHLSMSSQDRIQLYHEQQSLLLRSTLDHINHTVNDNRVATLEVLSTHAQQFESHQNQQRELIQLVSKLHTVVVSGQKHPPSSPKRLRKAPKHTTTQHLTQQTLNIFTLPADDSLLTLLPASRTILNRVQGMEEFTIAQYKPSPPLHNEMGMIQTYAVDDVDPLNQTVVYGDALSMAPDYDLDQL